VVLDKPWQQCATATANDRYFGARVGESLDWTGWMPVLEAATKSRNLAGFLVRFIRAVGGEASSAHHQLDVGSEYAVFKERRGQVSPLVNSERIIAPKAHWTSRSFLVNPGLKSL
jgi:hypothetical protein